MKKTLLIAICMLSALNAFAQEESGAEAVLAKYLDAMKTYDTALMSSLMHPEALQQFRAPIEAALSGDRSEMARGELLPLFSVTSVSEFAELTSVEAYKRMSDTIASAAPELLEMMRNSDYEIIGEVVRDGVTYSTYVITITMQGRSVSSEAVQRLKQHDGEWLLLLPADGEASIAGIEERYGVGARGTQ